MPTIFGFPLSICSAEHAIGRFTPFCWVVSLDETFDLLLQSSGIYDLPEMDYRLVGIEHLIPYHYNVAMGAVYIKI